MSDRQHPVGIDLGTTFSVVAYVDDAGKPITIVNAEGDLTTPSAVLFEDDEIIVGREAFNAAALEPERVALCPKREMGKPEFSKPINGEFYPPEVIQSLILEKLKTDAEAKLGSINEVVITVPAYFNEPRRKATQDAGRMVGLKVLDIVNEPTAAAIAYGVQAGFLDESCESKKHETLLVYDLGGGTFDVSLMKIDAKTYEVVATDGNVRLGGIDWDRRIVDFIAEAFAEKHGIDLRNEEAGLRKLEREAENAKRALSAREKVSIPLEHAGNGVRISLTREQFEEMTANLLERTRFTTTNLLQSANATWKDLTRILLVGGSTRMPAVAEMLERESGISVDRTLSADEAVAQGAAIYAGLLRSVETICSHDVRVSNVNSHSLGVLGVEKETARKRNRILIPKNTALPTRKTARFQTSKNDQRSVVIEVVEGGDASGSNSTAIGQCVIRDLPAGLPSGTAVDVAFSYSSNGRLTVHGRVSGAQKEARIDIDRVSGLTEAKLDEWQQRINDGFRPLNLK